MWENGTVRNLLGPSAGVADLTTALQPTVVKFSKHDLRPSGSWHLLHPGRAVRFRRTPGASWASVVEI